MKKAMCFLLALVLLLPLSAGYSSADAPEESEFYSDIYTTDPYCEAVTYLYHQGIMFGTGDGIFSPNATLTRAEVVTVIWRMAGRPAPEGTTTYFSDCPSTAYYYDAVRWASSSDVGIAYGTSSHTFSPTLTVTQQDTLTFLYRFICYCGYITDHYIYYTFFAFSDLVNKSSFSSYAHRAVGWAYNKGIFSDNTLFGTASCPRKDLAMYSYALYQRYQHKYGLVVTRSETMSSCTRCGEAMRRVFHHYGATATAVCDNINITAFDAAMDNAFGTAKPLDICYLYCASHGSLLGLGLFTGTDNQDTYLTPEKLRDSIIGANSEPGYKGTFVILIFGCHTGTYIERNGNWDTEREASGIFDAEAFVAALTSPGRSGELATSSRIKVLCSCKKNQVVHYIEYEQDLDESYDKVTMFWCKGAGYNLLQNTFEQIYADTNADLWVSLDELYSYSYVNVFPLWQDVAEIVCYPQQDSFVIFENIIND